MDKSFMIMLKSERNNLKKHILLVDDDQEVLNALKLILTALGNTVYAFSDADKAIVFLKENHDRIDLFLCDLLMYPKSGMEVLRETMEFSTNIPFFMMSANASDEDEKKAYKLGSKGFVQKPTVHLKIEELLRAARSTSTQKASGMH
jgi:DNA-binding NtrC family response regulator